MINRLELELERMGDWHISAENNFQYCGYFSTGNVFVETRDIIDAHVHFCGKNYKTNSQDYVKIKNIYYNDLVLPDLVEYTEMQTDQIGEYANLERVDYISFNGVWRIRIADCTVEYLLRKRLT